VKLRIAWIGKTRSSPIRSLTEEYVKRLSRYAACEAREVASDASLLKLGQKSGGRMPPVLVLLDSSGRQLTSEEIADFLESHQTRGTQELLFAVGGPDGWSEAARAAAYDLLSFGRITLPHELARVVLLEQLYRAFTILHRHPYHGGH